MMGQCWRPKRMKRLCQAAKLRVGPVLLGAWLGCLALGSAQQAGTNTEANADAKQDPPRKASAAAQQSLAFQADMHSRLFSTPVTVDGAIPRAVKAGNPLQMINPFAPMEYGDGYDNVTLDQDRKKATGISLFNLKF